MQERDIIFKKDTFCKIRPLEITLVPLAFFKMVCLNIAPRKSQDVSLHFLNLAPIRSAFPKFIFCKLQFSNWRKHSAFPLQSESCSSASYQKEETNLPSSPFVSRRALFQSFCSFFSRSAHAIISLASRYSPQRMPHVGSFGSDSKS